MNENVIQKRKAAMHKYGFQSFIIMSCLVLADGIIRGFYDWADPFTGSCIIFMAAALYLTVRLIFSGVYYSEENISLLSASPLIYATTFFLIVLLIVNFHKINFISSGRITDDCSQILMTFYLTVISIAIFVKKIRDKSKAKKGESNGN